MNDYDRTRCASSAAELLCSLHETLIEAATRELAAPPALSAPARYVYYHAILRMVAALDSAGLLLRHGQWWSASAVVRQLFELLLSMEDIARQSDQDGSATRYLDFGMLQQSLHQLRRLEYATQAGLDEDGQATRAASALRNALPERYPSFKTRKDWASTWNGKSAWAMAKESGSLRLAHYELVFRPMSEQVHGSPGAVTGYPLELLTSETRQLVMGEGVERTVEMAAFSSIFALEIWNCTDIAPGIANEEQIIDEFARLLEAVMLPDGPN